MSAIRQTIFVLYVDHYTNFFVKMDVPVNLKIIITVTNVAKYVVFVYLAS